MATKAAAIPTCDAQRRERPPSEGERAKPRPRCNRSAGHDGPHVKYDTRTFAVLFQWEDADCIVAS